MAQGADERGRVLAEAWGRVPISPDPSGASRSFARRRIDRVLTLLVGLGCLIVGVQAGIAALAPAAEPAVWHGVLSIAVFAALVGFLVACVAGRALRVASAVLVAVYAAALAAWPVLAAGVAIPPDAQPWIWYLLNVVTVSTTLGFSLPVQVVTSVAMPLLYGAVRMAQSGFGADYWVPVALDVSFSVIFGSVLLTLGWVLRSAADNVDDARTRAVESYADAAAADAAEQERIAVAALMHDSVLAALIAAERAESPREQSLAAGMAREALTRLADAEGDVGEGSDRPQAATGVAAGIERSAAELGVELRVSQRGDPGRTLVPGRVGRALVLAATQAVTNAVAHADGAGLVVTLVASPSPPDVRIEVRDRGCGFDLDAVPEDRLGIRASIMARMAAVGGRADVVSSPSGTVVRVRWAGGGA